MDCNDTDECFYMGRCSHRALVIALYVNYLLIACSSDSMLSSTKEKPMKAFRMKDLGKSSVILGMNVQREWNTECLTVSQSWFASKIISRFKMKSAERMSTPMGTKQKATSWTELVNHEIYLNNVGALMFSSWLERAQVSFILCHLGKFCQDSIRYALKNIPTSDSMPSSL